MKNANILEVHGSITKSESLIPIEYSILEHTSVAEAKEPYADYYGIVPRALQPNSLYLFTKQFYPLDELLEFTCDMKAFFGFTKRIDAATAILDFGDHYQYAIRINNFPDYKHIHWLQSCYNSEGVNFCKKVHMNESARATVFKQFILEEKEEGVFLDEANDHKGYITIPRQITNDEFSDLLIYLRNNNDCDLFDAALGTIEINSKKENIVRIYSEHIKVELLKCAKAKFSASLMKREVQPHKF